MSKPVYSGYAGDTTDIWELGFDLSQAGEDPVMADLTDGYSCYIAVQNSSPAINRAVTLLTADHTRFRAYLTSAETTALGAGDWLVGIEIRNAALTPPLVKEYQLTLKLAAGVVT